MQTRSQRSQMGSRPDNTTHVTSAIGMQETVGPLRTRRHSLFARTTLWVTGLVCAALLLATVAQVWSNSQLTNRLQVEQQQLQQLRNKNTSLKNDVEKYNDPLIIEQEAREKLNYARPGEQVVAIIASGTPTPQATQQQGQGQSQPGFWQAWWQTFFGA